MEKVTLFNPFPKQLEFIKAAFSGKYNMIVYGGSIRGGKTYVGLGTLIMLARAYNNSRWAIVRQDLERIKKNVLPAWEKIKPLNFVKSRVQDINGITFNNDSEIFFFPENYVQDKTLERWKGLEVNGFLLEEISEMQEVSFYKAIERAGSYVIPKNGKQPKPLILATCNPSQGWVKKLIYDRWENGTLPDNWLYIPAKAYDNPYNPPDYIKSLQQLPEYQRLVFVEGHWNIQLKVGGEFWKSFDVNRHVRPEFYNPETALHITVDNNLYPYIAQSIWQIEGRKIRQIHEIPATDPDNTAIKSAQLFCKWAKQIGYNNVVFVYGDQTTTQGNTIDDNKRSFFDKYTEIIRANFPISIRMPSTNPPVAISGAFVNEIYESNYDGLEISIGESCTTSINDYIMTKENPEGGILKKRVKNPTTGISYEEHGHFSDIMRYIICEAFKDSFARFKRNTDNVPRIVFQSEKKLRY